MSTPLLLLGLFLITDSWRSVGSKEWGYSELNVPEGWEGECAGGKHQSPINLAEEDAYKFSVEPLVFINYANKVKTTFKNNGHTVVLTVDQPCEVGVTSGDLRGMFHLDELHFHWGSEHTIENKRYALELHLVHHNIKYGSKMNSLNYTKGLAVIGVMFHESEKDNPNLDPVIKALQQVVKSDTVVSLPNVFSPLELLPEDRSHFFRYLGSLTTPPCTESVIWTVFQTSLPISKQQLEKFHTVQSHEGPLIHNYRKVQSLNDRYVYLLSDEEVERAAAYVTTNRPLLLFVTALICIYFNIF